MSIAVVGYRPTIANGAMIVDILQKYYPGSVVSVFNARKSPTAKNIDFSNNASIYANETTESLTELIEQVDHLIVLSAGGLALLRKINPKPSWKTKAIFFSTSHYARNPEYWYGLVKGFTVYLMPDLNTGLPHIPFYPPVNIDLLQSLAIPRQEQIVIGHSASSKLTIKVNRKGTRELIKLVNPKIITGVSWQKNIKQISQCHIFIDSLIKGNPHAIKGFRHEKTHKAHHYDIGGIGKSGLEAMVLGCCTMASGIKPHTSKYFPPPPVIWMDLNSVKHTVNYYSKHPQEREHMAKLQKQWAHQYLESKYIYKHITQHVISN